MVNIGAFAGKKLTEESRAFGQLFSCLKERACEEIRDFNREKASSQLNYCRQHILASGKLTSEVGQKINNINLGRSYFVGNFFNAHFLFQQNDYGFAEYCRPKKRKVNKIPSALENCDEAKTGSHRDIQAALHETSPECPHGMTGDNCREYICKDGKKFHDEKCMTCSEYISIPEIAEEYRDILDINMDLIDYSQLEYDLEALDCVYTRIDCPLFALEPDDQGGIQCAQKSCDPPNTFDQRAQSCRDSNGCNVDFEEEYAFDVYEGQYMCQLKCEDFEERDDDGVCQPRPNQCLPCEMAQKYFSKTDSKQILETFFNQESNSSEASNIDPSSNLMDLKAQRGQRLKKIEEFMEKIEQTLVECQKALEENLSYSSCDSEFGQSFGHWKSNGYFGREFNYKTPSKNKVDIQQLKENIF